MFDKARFEARRSRRPRRRWGAASQQANSMPLQALNTEKQSTPPSVKVNFKRTGPFQTAVNIPIFFPAED